MRPRKTDTDLPPCVYLRRGTYFYVKRGEWTNVGKTLEEALLQIEAIKAGKKHVRGTRKMKEMEDALRKVFRARRSGATIKKVPFEITEEFIRRLAKKSNWCCSMTGIPFNLKKPEGRHRNPFAPSIDRIDNKLGYVEGNVRVVCLATNFAMNEWGEDVLQTLALGWFSKRVNRSDSPEF